MVVRPSGRAWGDCDLAVSSDSSGVSAVIIEGERSGEARDSSANGVSGAGAGDRSIDVCVRESGSRIATSGDGAELSVGLRRDLNLVLGARVDV